MKSLTSVSGYKSVLYTALAVSFMLFFAACGGGDESTTPTTPDFTVSNMEGNWSMHGISFALTGNPFGDGNFKGWGTINVSGDFTGGSFEDSNGMVAPLTGGSLLLKDNGEFNGTVVATGPIGSATLNIDAGKMTSSKDILVFVETSTDMGSIDLGAVIKQDGTFATSDLAGKWHMFGPSVNGGAFGGAPEGTIWGSYDIDANGSLVGGGVSTSDDMNMSVVGGTLAINGDGEVTGIVTAFAGQDFNVTIGSGKMDPSKNIIFMVSQTALGSNELMVAVKDGGTFSSADMEGKWYLYGVSVDDVGAVDPTGKLTITGSVEYDASGNIASGSYSFRGESTQLQPVPATITSGTTTLNSNGVVSGSVNATTHLPQGDENEIITVVSGKMTPSKNIVIWVAKTTFGSNAFIIGIKGN